MGRGGHSTRPPGFIAIKYMSDNKKKTTSKVWYNYMEGNFIKFNLSIVIYTGYINKEINFLINC